MKNFLELLIVMVVGMAVGWYLRGVAEAPEARSAPFGVNTRAYTSSDQTAVVWILALIILVIAILAFLHYGSGWMKELRLLTKGWGKKKSSSRRRLPTLPMYQEEAPPPPNYPQLGQPQRDPRYLQGGSYYEGETPTGRHSDHYH